MSDEPLTNAAVDFARRTNAFFNSLAEAPTAADHAITDDFTLEDRRSGGVNFGWIDASNYASMFGSAWDVGAGQPQLLIPEVLAVRGERLAAVVLVVNYQSGPRTEFVICVCLDPELRRWQRMVSFDLDDVDGAIVELDRMQAAEIDRPN